MNNDRLARFEIKPPDYDWEQRNYVGMRDTVYAPTRFVKRENWWQAKDTTNGKQNSVRIMFTGDITCFEKQFAEAQKGESYDFSYELEQVKPVFEQADLVVGNLETMIVPEAPYRTEKYVSEQNFHCNAPVEFLDALKKAGFDVLTNANNHDLDTGAIGIGETIDYVEKFGFIHTGTFKSEKKRYELIDVAGYKIAITAFATEHNNKKSNLTPEGRDYLLNDYSSEKAKCILDEARTDGAELVFVCIHWGKEHKLVQNKQQMHIAEELAQMGYDCIIGSHPHVLQPFDRIDGKERQVPVFYSMGNFLSHNVSGDKSRSVIACVDLHRKGTSIELECSYIPICTSKDFGHKKFVVLPIKDKPLKKKNMNRKRIIESIMGDQIGVNLKVQYEECVEKPRIKIDKKAPRALELTADTEYPASYDDGSFKYAVYENCVWIQGLSEMGETQSYSAPDVVMGKAVYGVLPGAFSNCKVIKKINFKKNLKFVSEKMFYGCKTLEGLQIGNVREIHDEAFSGCAALSCIVLKNVETIGEKAFCNCTALRSVKISPKVRYISEDAFEGCLKAVFYCEKGSYAENYATDHGFDVVYMKMID